MIERMSCKGISVLVAEDSEATQELYRHYFQDLGCHARYAENGEEAVILVKKDYYDICLMDIEMPVMGGLEASYMIRQITEALPIIAVTAYIKDSNKELCFKAGMTDFLSKPIYASDLEEIILKYTKIA
jgi:CheY-like chemotaxis protein